MAIVFGGEGYHYGSGWIHSVLLEEFVDLSLAVVQAFAFSCECFMPKKL